MVRGTSKSETNLEHLERNDYIIHKQENKKRMLEDEKAKTLAEKELAETLAKKALSEKESAEHDKAIAKDLNAVAEGRYDWRIERFMRHNGMTR